MSAYLKLDKVRGEARAAGYAGWIEVLSVQLGNAGRAMGTGSSSAAQANVARGERDLFFTARYGLHSAELTKMALDGRSTDGEVALVDAGGARYATVKLVDALVTSYQTSGGSVDPTESFGLQTRTPFTYTPSTAALLTGRWLVTIGKWTGFFVFEANGTVYWTERNGTGRHNGLWKATAADVQWRFAGPGDIRTFVIPVPIPSGQVGGRILPVGQGFFTMQRA